MTAHWQQLDVITSVFDAFDLADNDTGSQLKNLPLRVSTLGASTIDSKVLGSMIIVAAN